MSAKYICIEGTEGVGKTTQTNLLVEHLKSQGFKVLQTKEPGTPLSPLTMEMRKLMLDAQFDKEMTREARELISQAIRSVHIHKVLLPAFQEYDFIIQDRGVLSGLAYGVACGNSLEFLQDLSERINAPLTGKLNQLGDIYNKVIYLTSDNTAEKLQIAKNSKQEFVAGDAMEQRGNSFILNVQENINAFSQMFNTVKICVDDKGIRQVFLEILANISKT